MKVYVALKGTSHGGISKILGVFASEELAVAHALKEPTYVHGCEWTEDPYERNRWTNNANLYVKVSDFVVE